MLRDKSGQRLDFDREHGWKISDDWIPAVPGIGRGVDLSAGGSKIYTAFIERVDGHGIAQHVYVTVALRQALGERLPFVSAFAAAVDAQLALVHVVLGVALDRDDVNCLGLVGVDVYPPAMAPMIKKGSRPVATASGSGSSGGVWDRSSSQAKKRKKGRRCWVT